jgi:hypothetical protein
MGADGKINRRLYETATLAHLRNKLRSGDVWVERSSAYRKFDSYLLPEKAVAPIISTLGLPATANEWLDQRGKQLDWRLKKFALRLKRNQLDGVTLVDDRLQITPVRTVVPAEAEALADQLDAILLRIRITELLHEVARETGFMAATSKSRSITQTLGRQITYLRSARCWDSGFVPGCGTSQVGAWCRSISLPHILESPRCWGSESVPT